MNIPFDENKAIAIMLFVPLFPLLPLNVA